MVGGHGQPAGSLPARPAQDRNAPATASDLPWNRGCPKGVPGLSRAWIKGAGWLADEQC